MTPGLVCTDGADLASEAATPDWLAELEGLRAARVAHFFVLHGNVADYVYDGRRPPYRLPAYLVRHLAATGWQRIGVLGLSRGLLWIDGGRPDPPAPGDAAAPAACAGGLLQDLRRLEHALRGAGPVSTAVVVESVEHIAPRTDGVRDREVATASEILTRLALDEGLRAAPVVLIGLCGSLPALAAELVEAPGGAAVIAVPLPRPAERRRFLRYLAAPGHAVGLAPLEPALTLDGLVNVTQGVTLAGLDALNRAARVAGEPITARGVRDHKREAIERQSRGLLEDIEPRHGFDAVGGLVHVVGYLRRVVAHLRAGRAEAAPKGILLAGPPGTGKTLVAEALAREAGFNLVRLGDVRSMWVGESERNLSHALRLVLELAPVVTFVDEVDQLLGARDRGWQGDSGVSARLFGRVLNFMGRNEHRGRVVWVAATNRPDLLDEAMIRRFDRVFPFFVPGARERERILGVLPRLTGVAYAAGASLAGVAAATEGLTGSALETIVRRAAELAWPGKVDEAALLAAVEDYKPNHDPAAYRVQSLLALDAANLYSSLPPAEDLPAEIAEVVAEMRRQRSAAPLHARLRALGGPGAAA